MARATEWLDQQRGRMPLQTLIMGLDLRNWLEAHVLLEEAKRLLRSSRLLAVAALPLAGFVVAKASSIASRRNLGT